MRRYLAASLIALTVASIAAPAGASTPTSCPTRGDAPPVAGCFTTATVTVITAPAGPTTTIAVDCSRLPSGDPPIEQCDREARERAARTTPPAARPVVPVVTRRRTSTPTSAAPAVAAVRRTLVFRYGGRRVF